MNNKTVEISIYDLELSNKSKKILTRLKIMTLADVVHYGIHEISSLSNISDDVLGELTDVIARAEVITKAFEERANRINEILPDVQDISINELGLRASVSTALTRGGIHTVGALIQMSKNDIFKLRNVGELRRNEIAAVIDKILRDGTVSLGHATAEEKQNTGIETEEKGFDFSVIDDLMDRFAFKPAWMAEWFGLSRQSIYNVMEKRSPRRRSVWTGKELSENERFILEKLIDGNCFSYRDDEVTCYCINNRMDDFVCLFIYENEIKCFYLKDFSDTIRQRIISEKMHRYTERELAGESNGKVVYSIKKPYFCPDYPDKFRANAQLREMTMDEYATFISGYPYIDQRRVTDEQIISFLACK
jgi:hypothetical protein